MDLGLKGRRAFVAAASRGLGKACAAALAAEGAQVFIASRDAKAIEAAAKEIGAAGWRAADLPKPREPEAAVWAGAGAPGRPERAGATFPGPPPPALHNPPPPAREHADQPPRSRP